MNQLPTAIFLLQVGITGWQDKVIAIWRDGSMGDGGMAG